MSDNNKFNKGNKRKDVLGRNDFALLRYITPASKWEALNIMHLKIILKGDHIRK